MTHIIIIYIIIINFKLSEYYYNNIIDLNFVFRHADVVTFKYVRAPLCA